MAYVHYPAIDRWSLIRFTALAFLKLTKSICGCISKILRFSIFGSRLNNTLINSMIATSKSITTISGFHERASVSEKKNSLAALRKRYCRVSHTLPLNVTQWLFAILWNWTNHNLYWRPCWYIAVSLSCLFLGFMRYFFTSHAVYLNTIQFLRRLRVHPTLHMIINYMLSANHFFDYNNLVLFTMKEMPTIH